MWGRDALKFIKEKSVEIFLGFREALNGLILFLGQILEIKKLSGIIIFGLFDF